MAEKEAFVYIVVSQTGTVFSRIIKAISKKEYNHASISFCKDISLMYSFGRLNAYNPFVGGFVKESADFGTFKRFKNTKILLVRVPISEEQLLNMENTVKEMFEHRKEYKYNYFGVYFAAVGLVHKKENSFYCSEFVKEILEKSNINGTENLGEIIHPMNFLELNDCSVIYSGKLKDYKNYINKSTP